MNTLVSTLGIGILAFTSTNLDDIFLLCFFFASAVFSMRSIVFGQYLGVTFLIAISALGFLFRLILSPVWIGLLGILPILLGIKILWKSSERPQKIISPLRKNMLSQKNISGSLLVAGITISCGADNIAIYGALFANSTWWELLILIGVFEIMIGIWCFLAYLITKKQNLKRHLESIQWIFPFLLILLGIFILIQSKAYQVLPFFP